jgi:hypothetical protein
MGIKSQTEGLLSDNAAGMDGNPKRCEVIWDEGPGSFGAE